MWELGAALTMRVTITAAKATNTVSNVATSGPSVDGGNRKRNAFATAIQVTSRSINSGRG